MKVLIIGELNYALSNGVWHLCGAYISDNGVVELFA